MSQKKSAENIDLNLEDIFIVFVRSDEVVADINQKGHELLGYPKDEVVGKNWFDNFIPQSNREDTRLSFHQLLNGTYRRGISEKPVLTKNGQERIIGWHDLIVKDEKGNSAGVISSGQDITERKLVEDRHILLASFPTFYPNPVVEVDFTGKITFTNPAVKKILPNLEKKGLDQPFFSDWDKVSLAFKNSISMDYSFAREIEIGSHWYLQEFSYVPIGPRLRIFLLNIDEKKQAEEALKESEGKYRSLFENMINGYAYCRMVYNERDEPVDFVYLEINDAFEKITGLKRDDVVGRRVSQAIPGTLQDNPEIVKTYGRVARSGKAEAFEVFFKPLKFWLNISVYCPRRDHFVAIFENITKRKELEQELNSYNQRLEEVVARRTAEYAQTNKKLTQEIMERRKSEEGLLFRAMILDNLKEAIFLANLKGEFVYANHAACELFGYSCEELVNTNFLHMLQMPDAQKRELMDKLVESGEIELETSYVRKDKVVVPIQLPLSLVKTAHGKLIISVIHKI